MWIILFLWRNASSTLSEMIACALHDKLIFVYLFWSLIMSDASWWIKCVLRNLIAWWMKCALRRNLIVWWMKYALRRKLFVYIKWVLFFWFFLLYLIIYLWWSWCQRYSVVFALYRLLVVFVLFLFSWSSFLLQMLSSSLSLDQCSYQRT
jgi:hypothetical protein